MDEKTAFELLQSPEYLRLLRIADMIDAGNMHGYDYSSDPLLRETAPASIDASLIAAESLAGEGKAKRAERIISDALDICCYILPERDTSDLKAMEKRLREENK